MAKTNLLATPLKKRGRPKKVRTEKELKKIEEAKKRKKTLAERQAIKLLLLRERLAKKIAAGEIEPKNKDKFYCTNKELLAELIKWRDSAKKCEDRIISERLGEMIISISQKVLNHSNFRNYSKELKEDMQGFFYYKIIKGLKNYNFEFNNPFAFFTQAAFNAYISVIGRYYKQKNIKKDLMKKLLSEIETYSGMSASSALDRCIKAYIGED